MQTAAAAAAAEEAFMRTGGRTTQPVGHYEFCQMQPGECDGNASRNTPVELSRSLWTLIVETNDAVNAEVSPQTDLEMWGREEFWSYPAGIGDCEDYVLEKRRRLMDAGVPMGNLLITVVRQRNGAGHAVLTIKTSRGDFVLDNLEPRILAWNETDYTFLKRQSEQRAGIWLSINSGSSGAVASVR